LNNQRDANPDTLALLLDIQQKLARVEADVSWIKNIIKALILVIAGLFGINLQPYI